MCLSICKSFSLNLTKSLQKILEEVISLLFVVIIYGKTRNILSENVAYVSHQENKNEEKVH